MMAPNIQVQNDVQSVLKITLADGSDASEHFSQNSIGNSIPIFLNDLPSKCSLMAFNFVSRLYSLLFPSSF